MSIDVPQIAEIEPSAEKRKPDRQVGVLSVLLRHQLLEFDGLPALDHEPVVALNCSAVAAGNRSKSVFPTIAACSMAKRVANRRLITR